MTDQDRPDLEVEALKLWRSARDFGRAFTKSLEETWGNVTQPETKPDPRVPRADVKLVQVPEDLVRDIVETVSSVTGASSRDMYTAARRLRTWVEKHETFDE